MGFSEICLELFRNFMGLLMDCFLNCSSQHGGEDEDQTLRVSSSSTPTPWGEGLSSPFSFEAGSSSTLSSSSEQQYEVFMSFRGDTRHGFTDYLYTRLINSNVSVFRDKEGLSLGKRNWPEIVKAIENSKISILVISPKYASSEWCVNELIQILECKSISNQLVIPIFYRVKPSDLREKSYVESQPHKKTRHHLDGTHIEKWKAALMEVSYMTGLESEKFANGYEGELVEEVLTKVLKALKKRTLFVSDNLVGVDPHVEEIMRMVNVEGSNNVHAVLIHGMGGIGKTTLAKVVYNRLIDFFDCCSFLANIREKWSGDKDKVELQEQLFSNILGQKQSITSVDEGVKIIMDKFKNKKALILLDDVDDEDQVKKLAGKRNWLRKGSILIVTSRMKNVLKEWDKERDKETEGSFSYELNELNEDDSFILFGKHAFKKNHSIPNEFNAIVKEIVSTTGGLPLAIEVIGCFLDDQNQDIWEEILKKLKEIPDDKVQNKLKISFDTLKHEEQEIFLDIACLQIHNEKEREYALHMWNSCGFYPKSVIQKLVSMSLIKIGERKELIIHDQLRDLGREIVRRESINLGERSRLWKIEEVEEVLELKKGTKNVQTLSLVDWDRRHYTSEQFREMTELRFLRMGRVDLSGDFENLFQNLRWLSWGGVELDFTESNFIPKKLVVLELWINHELTEGWLGWSQMKDLKVLSLEECYSLTTIPDLSALEDLEVLRLDWCTNVIEIHPSIGSLVKLRRLVMCYCKLIEIPKSIGNLKLLIEIDLSGTRVTQLPDSVGDLCNLESLILDDTPIRRLPTSIRKLSKLQKLNLWNCLELQSLPSLPCSLTSLEFFGKLMETLPDFSNLTNLGLLRFNDDFTRWNRALNFRNLNRMRTLRFGNLIEFGISHSTKGDPRGVYVNSFNQFKRSEMLWSASKLLELPSNLVELRLEGHDTLRTLPNFSNLKNLSLLCVQNFPELTKMDGFDGVEKLKDLEILNCRNLVEINGLGNVEGIQQVSVGWCSSLERIGDLSHLKMLTTLNLYCCNKLSEIQGLENLTSLEVLNIYTCTALGDLPNLPKDNIRSYTDEENERKAIEIGFSMESRHWIISLSNDN